MRGVRHLPPLAPLWSAYTLHDLALALALAVGCGIAAPLAPWVLW